MAKSASKIRKVSRQDRQRSRSKSQIDTEADDGKNKLGPFEFHGLDLSQGKNGSQATGDCPFCGKESHFHVNPKTGQWDCKICGEQGNTYTFLTKLHQRILDRTTKADWQQLSEYRHGIPWEAFRDQRIGWSDYPTERFYIPVLNGDSSLAGLSVWEGPEHPVIATKGTSQHLYRGNLLAKLPAGSTIYVCEGFFDAIALVWLLDKLNAPGTVVGAPGASCFKDAWVELFKDHHVIFLYDNDEAGRSGQQKAADLLSPVARSLKMIRWPENLPDKFDVNNWVSQQRSKPKSGWKELQTFLVPYTSETADAPPRDLTKRAGPGKPPSWQAIVKVFREELHLDKSIETSLAVAFATVLSIHVPPSDCPVWLFLVGVPGIGKTLLLRCFEDCEVCLYQSSITPKNLISGFKDWSDPTRDFSLLTLLHNRVLVIKDYTTIMTQQKSQQTEVQGILRDAFDGRVDWSWGNQERVTFLSYFATLAGVTHAVQGDRTSLGERFLKCEFVGEGHDPVEHIQRSIRGREKFSEVQLKLKAITADFLDRDIPKKIPAAPAWLINRASSLGQLIEILRAPVDRDSRSEISFRPRAGIGTRPANQLIKLAQSLALLFNQTTIDQSIYQTLVKVALDSCDGWHRDIMLVLLKAYPRPLKLSEIADQAHMAESSLQRKLDNLKELRAIVRSKLDPEKVAKESKPSKNTATQPIASDGKARKGKVDLAPDSTSFPEKKKTGKGYILPGQPAYGYKVEPGFYKIWKSAKVDQ